jgi:hypothetical protein
MLTKKLHQTFLASAALCFLFNASAAIGASNLVTDVSLRPDTPNIVANGQNVTVSFKYKTNQAGGVRIWARPFTNNALSPNYAACGSPVYSAPGGAGTCTFTISSGNVNVDNIRFQMYTVANPSKLLFEALIPVHYKFR